MSRLWLALVVAMAGCQEAPQEAPYDTGFDMHNLMTWVLEPAADVVWDSGGVIITAEGEQNLTPTTQEGWDRVQAAGAMIVESGNMLMLPERMEGKGADWMEFSKALSAMGHQVIQAAQAQDEEANFQAGANLYSVCVACHQVYALDL